VFSSVSIKASSSGELIRRAVPSTTTGLFASSVATTQRGFAVRFLDLRDGLLLLNQNSSLCHIPQTGIACGRPPGHVVTSQ